MASHQRPQSSPAGEKVLVIAIDFGTTYSGYAFSFGSDFLKNPLDIQCLNMESGATGQKSQTAKVPTCVLFTSERSFHSFGYDAENKYAEMCDNDRKEAAKWYFFDRFKMTLHKKQSLSRDLKLLDKTSRKSMLGLEVFSACIRHLKDSALAEVRKKIPLWDREVHWVLTVPAIWDDNSKQFMREAARMAGIEDNHLTLALEPECASVFCQRYFQSDQSSSTGLSLTSAGRRFMTVDCGGGTVDISVFEVMDGGRLQQLHKPEGADCGGVKVDDAFKAFLQEILGFDKVTSIDNLEALELKQSFEQCKGSMGTSDSLAIRVPSSMVEMLEITLANENLGGRAKLMSKRLVVDRVTVQTFFTEAKNGIVSTMRQVLEDPKVGHVDAILLVGGFSESAIIQEAVRQAFPKKKVLVPPSPSSTVVMGAVLYGHRPQVITTRVAPFTYGVGTCESFVDGRHDPKKLDTIEGERLCKDVFLIFIAINEVVELDKPLPHKTCNPVNSGTTKMNLPIFKSTHSSPMYTTDKGCEKIGEITVEMPDLTGDKNRQVHVAMSVSGTELQVKAQDGNTKKEFSATCDFLKR